MTNELKASLGILAALVSLAVVGLLFEGNWPKAIRVGLAAATYLSGMIVCGAARVEAGDGSTRMPAWPFVASGCGAGLVSGLMRAEQGLAVVATHMAAAGLLLGGFHWLAVREWRRLQSRIVGR